MITALYIAGGLAIFYLGFWIGCEEMKYSLDDHTQKESEFKSNKTLTEAPKPKQPSQKTYERSTVVYEYGFTDKHGNQHEAKIFPN